MQGIDLCNRSRPGHTIALGVINADLCKMLQDDLVLDEPNELPDRLIDTRPRCSPVSLAHCFDHQAKVLRTTHRSIDSIRL